MKAVLERNLGFMGYPEYSVDTDGNVWSYLNNKWGITNKPHKLKTIKGNRGYLHLMLYNGICHKRFSVHRLVAMAFIPNPYKKPFIDHINAIRIDNNVKNLKWVTNKENCNNPNFIKSKTGENNIMFGKFGNQHHLSKPVLQFAKNGKLMYIIVI